MSFESDYKVLIRAIFLQDVSKAEELISQCDDKTSMILKAIEAFGIKRVKLVTDEFRSLGLKKNIEKVFSNHKQFDCKKDKEVLDKEKIVLVHHKNMLKNQLYHLSGSSFNNEIISEEELLFKLENSYKRIGA